MGSDRPEPKSPYHIRVYNASPCYTRLHRSRRTGNVTRRWPMPYPRFCPECGREIPGSAEGRPPHQYPCASNHRPHVDLADWADVVSNDSIRLNSPEPPNRTDFGISPRCRTTHCGKLTAWTAARFCVWCKTQLRFRHCPICSHELVAWPAEGERMTISLIPDHCGHGVTPDQACEFGLHFFAWGQASTNSTPPGVPHPPVAENTPERYECRKCRGLNVLPPPTPDEDVVKRYCGWCGKFALSEEI